MQKSDVLWIFCACVALGLGYSLWPADFPWSVADRWPICW